MKEKLLIIGASGHGKVVADIAVKMEKWQEIAFLDDNSNITNVLGLKVLGNTKEVSNYIDEYDIFIAIGNNEIRKKLYFQLENLGATIPTIIHPSAIIGEDVTIKNGTVIMARVVINCSTTIGKACIINTGSTIDHDNEIGNFVHISPGANLAGTVKVGESSWLGIGCVVSNNIEITKKCIIGAGGVVIKDLKESGVYVGVPVRRIK